MKKVTITFVSDKDLAELQNALIDITNSYEINALTPDAKSDNDPNILINYKFEDMENNQ